MEGTQHEKIGIVIAAYIIGFSTAFIAFGINNLKEEALPLVSSYQQSTWNNDVYAEYEEVTEGIIGVSVAQDGLFAVTAANERILSANQAVLSASVIDSSDLSGYYYEIIDAEASPNGMFVYFCEQLTAESETCDPYIYSLEDDSVHTVKVGEEKYKSVITEHASAWSTSSTLSLNEFSSKDAQKPWLLEPAIQ